MHDRIEVRIAGFGGQGVVLAGVLLGSAAAIYDKKSVIQTQSYGAEARGGAARSEVIISDSPIIYPVVLEPDIFVAMSQIALDKYDGDMKQQGTLIVDEKLVTILPERGDIKVYKGNFSDMASKKLGRSIVANAIMLGFLTSLTNIASAGAMIEAIRTSTPEGTEELNLRAFKLGQEIAAIG